MFLRNGVKYYPFEIRKIISKNGKTVYDRDKRGQNYIYIALTNTVGENGSEING